MRTTLAETRTDQGSCWRQATYTFPALREEWLIIFFNKRYFFHYIHIYNISARYIQGYVNMVNSTQINHMYMYVNTLDHYNDIRPGFGCELYMIQYTCICYCLLVIIYRCFAFLIWTYGRALYITSLYHTKTFLSAVVAQSVRAFALHAESWVLESQPWQTYKS